MPKRRKNMYFTDKQVERLGKKSMQENLPEAEIVRRAPMCTAWDDPAWDDPTYTPHPSRPKGEANSSLP